MIRSKSSTDAALSKLKQVTLITILFVIIQFIGGIWSGSIAILGDTAHLATDLLGFVCAVAAVKFSQKEANKDYSYGWHRAELIGTLVSVVSFWIMIGFLIYAASLRFYKEPMVVGLNMLIVSVFGLIFNLIQIRILTTGLDIHSYIEPEEKTGKKEVDNEAAKESLISPGSSEKKEEGKSNMNVDGALLHILGDLLNSVGVIIAALCIYLNERLWFLDPICTYIFSLIIICTSFPLAKRCIHIMMEATPDELDTVELHKDILNADSDNILEVHDLHVWIIGTNYYSLSVHVQSNDPLKSLRKVTEMLRADYNLYHTTVQVEGPEDAKLNPEEFECNNDMHIVHKTKQQATQRRGMGRLGDFGLE
jgi:solute carrier family 30 (zinc transporter), member 2